jgi:hypothetical protein
MIVVEYVEKIEDPTSGALSFPLLGKESHDKIDEILLPAKPTPTDPIFMTKKFAGENKCRWEVVSVDVDYSQPSMTYVVTLARREQVPKEFYSCRKSHVWPPLLSKQVSNLSPYCVYTAKGTLTNSVSIKQSAGSVNIMLLVSGPLRSISIRSSGKRVNRDKAARKVAKFTVLPR